MQVQGVYGGSAGGSGGGNHISGAHSKRRDAVYCVDVSCDFDSVWGDGDQSKISVSGSIDSANMISNNNVKDSNKEAYGNLHKIFTSSSSTNTRKAPNP